MTTFTIAVISAGLSQPSSTKLLADQLAEAARREAAHRGRQVQTVSVELRELAHDITNNLLTGFAPPALQQAIDQVTSADAIIAVTPVFSASYSGLFKSFFDVLDPQALVGTPVLMAATGGSARHSLVLDYALRPLFSYLKATLVSTGVFAATVDFGSDEAGRSLADRIHRAAAELVGLLEPAGPVDLVGPDEGGAANQHSGRARNQPGDEGARLFSALLGGNDARVGPGPAKPGRPVAEPDPFAEFVPFAELLAR